MAGIDTLLPLSRQTPVVKLAAAAVIYIAVSMILTLLVYVAGAVFFQGWDETRQLLGSGEIRSADVSILRYLQAGQDFSLFIIPSLLIARLMSGDMSAWMGFKRNPGFTSLALLLFLIVFLTVVNTFIAWLNSQMTFPVSWSSVEEWMREKELLAGKYTVMLTSGETAPSLLTNIMVVALLPAVGEELFFRGVIQKMLGGFFRKGHAAIWITAFIFSAIHLQFYGFLPRLLLGAIFGYLFYWSGSVWLPIAAHFLNNVIPITIAWRAGWDEGTAVTQEFARTNQPTVLLSAVAVIAILYLLRKELRSGEAGLNSAMPSE